MADSGPVTRFASAADRRFGLIVARERLEPRDVDRLVFPNGPFLVAAHWVSPRTRELGAGYLDRTSNIALRLDRPALYLHTDGARQDPNPKQKQGPSRRGARAWALLRTLAEVEPPLHGR